VTDQSDTPGITVVGRGEASARPDLAWVDLGVSVRADSVSTAASKAGDHAEAVLSVLDGSGVDRADVTTADYSVHPEYDHREGSQHLLGYRVTNRIRIRVTDLSQLGDLVDRSVAAAGDSAIVDNISFSINDDSTVSTQARELAWADARGKAEHLATLAGRQLGAVVSIVESAVRSPGPFPTPRLAAMAEGTPIEAGTATVTVTLVAKFELA
jgi:uncharacterized protein